MDRPIESDLIQRAYHAFSSVSSGSNLLSPDRIPEALSMAGIDADQGSIKGYISATCSSSQCCNFSQFYSLIVEIEKQQHRSSYSSRIDFISGSVAGVAVTCVGHPFDTIKVRLQTQKDGKFRNGIDCLTKTVRIEGPRALFKGMAGPLATLPLLNALVFWSYGLAKSTFEMKNGIDQPLSISQITLAGSFAGLLSTVIVCPLELIKTKMQIQYGYRNLRYQGPLHCTRELLSTEGLRGMFRGMSITGMREVVGYAGQFAVYEMLKSVLTEPGHSSSDLSAARLMFAGGISGSVAWLVSYPADFIKSRLQSVAIGQASPYRKHGIIPDGGAIDCYRQIVSRSGHRAVWAGFGPCIARAFPANAAGFLAYELSCSLLWRLYSS